ncbi:MAG: hypothetical protein IT158_06715 [Bryobacterales bacterium]|nr:hypothetical protein [Bryobacterales bacterium]
MKWILPLLLLSMALLLPAAQKKKAPAPEAGPPLETLTGCMDQSGEDFVLRDDEGLVILAILEPDGFPKNNFARYVGNRVTARGVRREPVEQPPRFKVRRIQQIAEGCAAPEKDDQPR